MIECQKCGISSKFGKKTIIEEVARLKSMQLQIPYISCPQCNTHYTEYALSSSIINNYFSNSDFEKAIAETQYKNSIESETMIAARKAKIDAEEKERQEKLAHEEKIRLYHIANMQSGKPFDPKIVGDVDMEESTPDERNCARVLRWESKLYAYSFLIIKNISDVIIAVGILAITLIMLIVDLIWSIAKKINWCIACSVGRMAYFVGYIGLVGYYGYRYINGLNVVPYKTLHPEGAILLDGLVIFGLGLPLAWQLCWASNAQSRWSNFIKKNMDKIIKK